MAALTSLALFSLVTVASACTVNPGGCTPDVCANIGKIKPSANTKPLFGNYFGILNKNVKKPRAVGGPVINYEGFQVRSTGSSFATWPSGTRITVSSL